MNIRRNSRRGVAIVVLLVLLAAIVAVSGSLTWHAVAGRRFLAQREHQFQAEWLARGGIEWARNRQRNGTPFRDEWKPMGDRAIVTVIVKKKDDADHLVSIATYPADEPRPVRRESEFAIGRPTPP